MLEDRFLYCRQCQQAHRLTPFDRAPLYHLQDNGVEETHVDDRRHYIHRHTGHEMIELVALKYYHTSRPLDPMKVTYVEVTDGSKSYLLRAYRKTIAEALSYKLVSRLRVKPPEIGTRKSRNVRARSYLDRERVERPFTLRLVD